MSDTSVEKLDWAAINRRLAKRNQQLLREHEELLKGVASRVMWGAKEGRDE